MSNSGAYAAGFVGLTLGGGLTSLTTLAATGEFAQAAGVGLVGGMLLGGLALAFTYKANDTAPTNSATVSRSVGTHGASNLNSSHHESPVSGGVNVARQQAAKRAQLLAERAKNSPEIRRANAAALEEQRASLRRNPTVLVASDRSRYARVRVNRSAADAPRHDPD